MKKILSSFLAFSFVVSASLLANGQRVGQSERIGGFLEPRSGTPTITDTAPEVVPLQQLRISAIGTGQAKKHETLSLANKLYDAICTKYFLDKDGALASPDFVMLSERRISRVVGPNLYLFSGSGAMVVQTTGPKKYADREILPPMIVVDDGVYSYNVVNVNSEIVRTRTLRKYRQTTVKKEVEEKGYTVISREKFVELLQAENIFPITLSLTRTCPTTVLTAAHTTAPCSKCNGTGKVEVIEPWEVIW